MGAPLVDESTTTTDALVPVVDGTIATDCEPGAAEPGLGDGGTTIDEAGETTCDEVGATTWEVGMVGTLAPWGTSFG